MSSKPQIPQKLSENFIIIIIIIIINIKCTRVVARWQNWSAFLK